MLFNVIISDENKPRTLNIKLHCVLFVPYINAILQHPKIERFPPDNGPNQVYLLQDNVRQGKTGAVCVEAGLLFPLLLLMESLKLNLTGASPFIRRSSAHEDRESSADDLLTRPLVTLSAPLVIRGDGTALTSSHTWAFS